MTEKLFYNDPYKTQWKTEITDSKKSGGNYEIILKATCFYPEGGGQPGDRGFINGCEVTDTIKEEGEIIHICSSDPGMGKAECSLDWDRRLDYMQQHTGQHIISAVLKNKLDINTVSVHQGEEYTAVETDRALISNEEIERLNTECNRLILENTAVKTFTIDSSALPDYPLRRPTERTGKIRIVELEDCDRVACGGVHMETAGEVRIIHVFSIEKLRNRCRVLAKIGDRAISDYALKSGVCAFFTEALSAPTEQLVEKMNINQEAFLKQRARAAELEKKLAEVLFQLIKVRKEADTDYYLHCFNKQDPAALKELVKKLMTAQKTVFCIGNIRGEKLLWQIGSSPDIDFPFNDIKEEVLQSISGKGGGKPPLWQGYGDRAEGFAMMAKIIMNYGKS